jgi:hypothetical protein
VLIVRGGDWASILGLGNALFVIVRRVGKEKCGSRSDKV